MHHTQPVQLTERREGRESPPGMGGGHENSHSEGSSFPGFQAGLFHGFDQELAAVCFYFFYV